MIKVIKIGGNVIDNPEKLSLFLNIYSKIEGPTLLVHGGGKIATELSNNLGIKAELIEGKRVTDAETLKIVTMVYAGLLNKQLVAKLQALGCNAIGLSGADGNLIRTTKKTDPNVDWGFVGAKPVVNTATLQALLGAYLSPVICAITHNGQGQLLNTNADTIASSIATALAATGQDVSLVYCFEKKGVLTDINNPESVIQTITKSAYQQLKDAGTVHTGMIPKLDNAFTAIENGVHEVKICMAEDLINFETAGTTIRA